MDLFEDENALVAAIRAQFPAEAAMTDDWVRARGWDACGSQQIPYAWVEAFAGRTADAIRRNDGAAVIKQTRFMASQYRNGSEALRTLIDVAYAENIMWDVKVPNKAWAREYIAPEIRELYQAMWGGSW